MALSNTDLVTQLYVGYYNRAPDPAGLQFWLNALNTGTPLAKIADLFATSPKSTAIYPFLSLPGVVSSATFVDQVYANVLNRAAEAEGRAFWIDQLDTGKTTAGGFILAIETSVNAQVGTPDALTLANKVTVGEYYVNSVAEANIPYSQQSAKDALAPVTSDAASVAAGEAVVDAYIQPGDPFPQIFNLTTSIDNIVGTAGSDLIIGFSNDLSLGDHIDGGAGNDTLQVLSDWNSTVDLSVATSNVEKLVVLNGSAFLTTIDVANNAFQSISLRGMANNSIDVNNAAASSAVSVQGTKSVSSETYVHASDATNTSVTINDTLEGTGLNSENAYVIFNNNLTKATTIKATLTAHNMNADAAGFSWADQFITLSAANAQVTSNVVIDGATSDGSNYSGAGVYVEQDGTASVTLNASITNSDSVALDAYADSSGHGTTAPTNVANVTLSNVSNSNYSQVYLADFATVNVTVNGASSIDELRIYQSSTPYKTQSLNIVANANLTVTDATSMSDNGSTSVTISGSGNVDLGEFYASGRPLSSTITSSIDASALTGKLSVVVGNDISSLKGGSGDDAVTLTQQPWASRYVIDGGAGVDTFQLLNGNSASTLDLSVAMATISNVEKLVVVDGSTYLNTIDVANNAFQSISLRGMANNSTDVNNVAAASAVSVQGTKSVSSNTYVNAADATNTSVTINDTLEGTGPNSDNAFVTFHNNLTKATTINATLTAHNMNADAAGFSWADQSITLSTANAQVTSNVVIDGATSDGNNYSGARVDVNQDGTASVTLNASITNSDSVNFIAYADEAHGTIARTNVANVTLSNVSNSNYSQVYLAAFATVNVTVNGASSIDELDIYDPSTDFKTQSLDIVANANLTVTDRTYMSDNGSTLVTISGSGNVDLGEFYASGNETLSGTITSSIDASALTGDLSVVVEDAISSLKGGSGDDTVTLTHGLAPGHIIDGGAGVDTLQLLNVNSASTLDLSVATISNVEKLVVVNGSTNLNTIDVANNAFQSISLRGMANNSIDVNNVAAASAVSVQGTKSVSSNTYVNAADATNTSVTINDTLEGTGPNSDKAYVTFHNDLTKATTINATLTAHNMNADAAGFSWADQFITLSAANAQVTSNVVIDGATSDGSDYSGAGVYVNQDGTASVTLNASITNSDSVNFIAYADLNGHGTTARTNVANVTLSNVSNSNYSQVYLADFATVNVTVNGASSIDQLDIYDPSTDFKTQSLDIVANANLTVTDRTSMSDNGSTLVTISGSGNVDLGEFYASGNETLSSTITSSIDASALTGDLSVVVGNDISSLKGGSGDDTVTLTHGLAPGHIIDGGAGVDTLSFDNVTGTLIAGDYALINGTVLNFEHLEFQNGVTLDANLLTGSYSQFASDNTGTITHVGSQALIAHADLTATATGYDGTTTPHTFAGSLNVTADGDASMLTLNAESATVTVNALEGSDVALASITGDLKSGLTVHTANATDAAGTVDYLSSAAITADATHLTSLTTVTLDGNGSITLDASAAVKLTTITSGLGGTLANGDITGGLTFTGNSANAEAITLGSGHDVITVASSTYGKMDSITNFDDVKETADSHSTTDVLNFATLNLNGAAPTLPTALLKFVPTAGATTLDLAFVGAAAASHANLDVAVQFQFEGNTYLFQDANANGGLDNTDLAVKVVGLHDLTTAFAVPADLSMTVEWWV